MFSIKSKKALRIGASLRAFTIGASLTAMGAMPVAANAQTWVGALLGANEVPANASPASGFATISRSGGFLNVSLTWSGLTGGGPTAGHIHCCTNPGTNVGVALGFLGLPNTSSGSYLSTFDLSLSSTYTTSFINNFGGGSVAGAEAALVTGLNSGRAYVNLHNAAFPGGEIRANVVVTPEPGSVLMLAVGMLGVGVAVRRKRRVN